MGFWKKTPEIKGSWGDEEEENPVVETTGKFVDQPEEEKVKETTTPIPKAKPTGKTVKVPPGIANRKTKTRQEILASMHINDRMDLVLDYYISVLDATITSLIVQGGPGLGKTYILLELLKKRGMVDGRDYLLIKAGVSAFGLYTQLCGWVKRINEQIKAAEDRGIKNFKVKWPLVIFDDVPLFTGGEKRLTELIKAMADSTADPEKGRKISWKTDRTSDDPEAQAKGKLPSSIYWKGGCIIITNEPVKKIDKPTQDRSVPLFLTVTPEEMVERMILLAPKMGPKTMNTAFKKQVVDWLCSSEFMGEELSMRTLHKALQIAHANPKRWKPMCAIL